MPTDLLAYDPPLVADAEMRQRLIDWLRQNAAAWERHADACRLWGAERGAETCVARAAVAEEFARGLEQAVRTFPEAWRPF